MEKGFYALVVNGNKTDYKVFMADTWFKRLMGWMFRPAPLNEGLLLAPCNSVHTFFMRFYIDLIFLDNKGCVVRLMKNIAPYNIILPVKNANQTLEFPANSIETLSIAVDDIFEFTL